MVTRLGTRPSAVRSNWRVVYAGLHVPTVKSLQERGTISLIGVARSLAFKANRHLSTILSLVDAKIPVIDFDDPDHAADAIRSLKADLLIINIWEIVPKQILDAFHRGAINVHPSMLPKYRGSLPTLWSLRNHDADSAVTFLVVGEIVDGGGILKQMPFSISKQDNWMAIERKIDAIVRDNIRDVIHDYLSGIAPTIEQSCENATSTQKYEAYRRIDPDRETVKDILNKVGYYPYWDTDVYAYIYVDERNINIKRIKEASSGIYSPSSFRTAWALVGMRLILNCKDGLLAARLFIDIPLADSLCVIRSYFRHRKGVQSFP